MTQPKDIPGYEGIYQIDADGQIFNLKTGQTRKASVSTYGYLTITLSKDGHTKTHRVHRLVAEAFVPNPMQLPFVNHIDGDKKNPAASNLEWVTAKENTQHALKNGLHSLEGETNPSAKLTDKEVEIALDRCLAGELVSDVAASMGVNRNTLPKRFKRTSRATLWKQEADSRKSRASNIRWEASA